MADTMKALQSVTVGAGGASTITFSNIPQTYTDLIIKMSTRAAAATVDNVVVMYFNGDQSAIYDNKLIYGTGLGVASGGFTNNTGGVIAISNAASSTTSTFANSEMVITNYASNAAFKAVSSDSVAETNATAVLSYLNAYLRKSTQPVTSITLYPFSTTWLQNSTFTLYGVFNADVSTPPSAPNIGTATAGLESASITFTGVSNAASYTMTSSPGSLTATGTTSPITVTGLTGGTSYTFTCKANNPFGSSAESSASNSIIPISTAYESIASVVVGAGGANTITFSSIPSTYKHLQIRGIAMCDFASDPGGGGGVGLRFNGDTSTNYTRHQFYGDGVGLSVYGEASRSTADIERFLYRLTSNNIFGAAVCDILDYADTNKYKTVKNIGGYDTNGAGEVNLNSAVWMSTSAITSIVIGNASNPLKQYSRFSLYGIKG